MQNPFLNNRNLTMEEILPAHAGASYASDVLGKAIALQKEITALKYAEPELLERLEILKSQARASRAASSPEALRAQLQEALLKPRKIEADIYNTNAEAQRALANAAHAIAGAESERTLTPARYEHLMAQMALEKAKAESERLLTPAQVQQALSAAELNRAHGSYYRAQTETVPQELYLRALKYKLEKEQHENPNFRDLTRAVGTLAGNKDVWMAENPMYNQLITDVLNKQALKHNIMPSATSIDNQVPLNNQLSIADRLNSIGASVAPPNADYPVMGNLNLSDRLNSLINQEATNLNIAPTKLTDEQLKNLNTKLRANRSEIEGQLQSRADNAIIIEKFWHDNKEEYMHRIKGAVMFSGIAGQGRKTLAKLKGSYPEEYVDYLWLQNFATRLGNLERRMENVPGSEKTIASIEKLSNPVSWEKNPKQAIQEFERSFADILSVGNAVISKSEPRYKGVQRKLEGLPEYKPFKGFTESGYNNIAVNPSDQDVNVAIINNLPENSLSDENIEKVAIKRNMSVEQLKQILHSGGIL